MPLLIATLALSLVANIESPAQRRGVVNAVTLSTKTVTVGTALQATASGVNPCGAVFIDWGDGTAITYAIASIPASQTHAYNAPGHYSIVAKGMGNCDGEARTAVDVSGPPVQPNIPPPPPPPAAPAITAVEMPQALVRRPVEFTIKGHGTCTMSVDFGDGNSQEESGVLPRTVKHAYTVPDTYVVVVRPDAPCTGKFTQKLIVTAQPPAARLTGLTLSPPRGVANQPVTIDIAGTGTCGYTIDYGDGNTEERTRQLPDRVRHTYPASDYYTVSITTQSPCTGAATASLLVRPRR